MFIFQKIVCRERQISETGKCTRIHSGLYNTKFDLNDITYHTYLASRIPWQITSLTDLQQIDKLK